MQANLFLYIYLLYNAAVKWSVCFIDCFCLLVLSFDRPSRRLLGLHQVLLNPDTEKSVLHLFRAAHANCSFNSPVVRPMPPALWVLLPSASSGFNLECLFQHLTLDFPKFVFLNRKQNIILTCDFISFHCFCVFFFPNQLSWECRAPSYHFCSLFLALHRKEEENRLPV